MDAFSSGPGAIFYEFNCETLFLPYNLPAMKKPCTRLPLVAVGLLLCLASAWAQQTTPPAADGPTPATKVADGEQRDRSARMFGVGPKFNVVRGDNPRPLNTGDKFRLFVADSSHPYQFVIASAVSGISMADHENRGFGQGGEGFAKRFGAAMADEASSNFFGTFLFPSIFRQDPRYFRQETGSAGQRIGYAVSRVVVTRSDTGTKQFNVSKVLGVLCSGALANAYYPESERTVERTFTTIGINFATTAGLNILKEFWHRKKTR